MAQQRKRRRPVTGIVKPNGTKRKFRVVLRDARGNEVTTYVVGTSTREVYRRLEREGIKRSAVLSTTAFADVPPASPTSRPRP